MGIEPDQIWRHKKRGNTYRIIAANASLQCASALEFESLFEDDDWTVYCNTETGAMYLRPTPEFLDGRFERVS